MPLFAGMIERFIILNRNRAPGFLIDLAGAQAFHALAAAMRLGIFETIRTRSRTSIEIADAAGVPQTGIGILLEALDALGYVVRKGNYYENSRLVKRWLLKDVPGSFAASFPFFAAQTFDFWNQLADTLRTGAAPVDLYGWLEKRGPRAWMEFQESMVAPALLSMHEIVRKAGIRAYTPLSIADIGGGMGHYSMHFCRAYPLLHSTIIDRNDILEMARTTCGQDPCASRIAFREADFRTGDLGGPYDVILLFNIIHGSTPDHNLALLHRVRAALKKGGRVIILDQLSDQTPGPFSRIFSRLHSLNLFISLGGRMYSSKEIVTLLRNAGFDSPRRIKLFSAPLFGLISAKAGHKGPVMGTFS
jgi:ubiquinone/menaquinone biosynthesis C-methylase UbiE